MKNCFLTLLIILSIGVSACYRDNWKTISVSWTDKLFDVTFKHKNAILKASYHTDYILTLTSNDCLNEIVVGEKLPECILPIIKHNAGIK